MENLKVYVRGNIAFPNGVIDRLKLLGGIYEDNFSEIDLSNSSNIFYIDYYNNNLISKVDDDSIIGETILSYWKEIEPFTYIDDPESLPENWNDAYDRFIEVRNYMQGKNESLDNLLNDFGKLIVLRNIYRQGWEPNANEFFYYIDYNIIDNDLEISRGIKMNKPISFQNNELCETFLNNFKDILDSCKELI